MTTPAVLGGLGARGSGLGLLGLGARMPVQSFALPAMATVAQPFIAHLYDHNLVFKRLLGAASVINKPGLKQTQNGGYQPIVLELATVVPGIVLGDVVRLTEQGDSAGTILYSGNVETTPEEHAVGGGATHHQLMVTPWVAELGDADFSKTYATATDVAQFVRDAVAKTAHCSVSPISCPDTGIKAIYDFQNTNALDAVHVAKQIAGSKFFYFVDAQGVVWFQVVNTSNPATLTLREGADFNRIKKSSTVTGMKNLIPVIGGSNPGDPGRITSLYSGAANQALYGRKTFNPTPSYPTVTDQPTLDAIAASLGAQFDRVLNRVEADCPALGRRLSPGRPGGLTVRFFEPGAEPMDDSPAGTGVYGPILVLQDVEALGPMQKLIAGDVPFSDTDTAYEAMRIAQRVGVVSATAVPTPPLVPPVIIPPPPVVTQSTVIMGQASAAPGIYPAGGGVVTVASSVFTTTKAGTCQVQGAIDARMEAWDDYVAAPRRAVRAALLTGIFTGTWQELPFGLTRATYDVSSASGIALPAGTYSLFLQIDTVEYNQIHVYSGWVQVAVTS